MGSRKSNYGKIKIYEEEILAMISVGKTHLEIAKHFGLKDRYVIKEFLKRKRRRERKIEQGEINPRRGNASSNLELSENKDNELKRLKMENELLRDFLFAVGRK